MNDKVRSLPVIATIMMALATFALVFAYFVRLIPDFVGALTREILSGEFFKPAHWLERDVIFLEAETLLIIATTIALSGLAMLFFTFSLPQKYVSQVFAPSTCKGNASMREAKLLNGTPQSAGLDTNVNTLTSVSRSHSYMTNDVQCHMQSHISKRVIFKRALLWLAVLSALETLVSLCVGGIAMLIYHFSNASTSVMQMLGAINVISSILNISLLVFVLNFLHNKVSTTPLHQKVAHLSKRFYRPALAVIIALAFIVQHPLSAKADTDVLRIRFDLNQTLMHVQNNARAPNTEFIGDDHAEKGTKEPLPLGAQEPIDEDATSDTVLRTPIPMRAPAPGNETIAQDNVFSDGASDIDVSPIDDTATLIDEDETSRTYEFPDGTFLTRVFDVPIMQRAESPPSTKSRVKSRGRKPSNAELRAIDTSLGVSLDSDQQSLDAQDSPGFTPKNVPYDLKLPTSGEGITLQKDAYTLQLLPQFGSLQNPVVQNSSIRYNNVGVGKYSGVDLQYTAKTLEIKEDIIINHPLAPFGDGSEEPNNSSNHANYTFDYILTSSPEHPLFYFWQNGIVFAFSATDVQIGDEDAPRGIAFDASTHGAQGTPAKSIPRLGATPIFTITAPRMFDSNGEFSTDLWLTLEDAQTLRLTVDSKWLDDLSRAYPVVIDPTIFLDGANMEWHFIENGTPDGNCNAGPNVDHYGNPYLYVGWERGNHVGVPTCPNLTYGATRSFIKINYDWQNLPDNVRLNAKLRGYKYTNSTPPGAVVYAEFVQEPWYGSAYTWNNQPMNRARLEGGQDLSGDAKWANWDITEHARLWKNGAPNYGIMLTASEEDQEAVVFSGPGNAHGRERFYMDITWQVVDGVDENLPLDTPNVSANVLTKKQVSGMQNVVGVFADGEIRPGLRVDYALKAGGVAQEVGDTTSTDKRVFPNSNLFNTSTFDLGIFDRFESNWQSRLFGSFQNNLPYKITARGSGMQTLYDGAPNPPDGGGMPEITSQEVSTPEGSSDTFIIYKFTDQDTIPFVAAFYGVSVEQLILDNRPRDYLAFPGNTWFIRNPTKNATIPYTRPSNLDDEHKRRLIYANNGRGMLSEFDLEPVNTSTGNFFFKSTDYTSNIVGKTGGHANSNESIGQDAAFNIVRNYNSIGAKDSANSGQFGRGWTFEYFAHLAYDITQNGDIILFQGDGSRRYFIKNADGSYTTPAGTKLKLTVQKDADQNAIGYTIIDMQGEPAQKTYNFDRYGTLQSIEDFSNRRITLQYDGVFIKSMIDFYGRAYNFTLNSDGNITEITLPNGSKNHYTYADGLLKTFTNADGNVIKYNYDENGQMTSWLDGNNVTVIENTYDDLGRVTEQTDANGTKTNLHYNVNETKITTNIDGVDVDKVYKFDENLRTIQRPEPVNAPQNNAQNTAAYTREIDDSYRILSQTDLQTGSRTNPQANQLGNVTSFQYDTAGNLTRETKTNGDYQEIIYNSQNLPVTVRDFSGNIMQKEYDIAGNLTKIIYSDGNFEHYIYDEFGRLLSVRNQMGGVSTFQYNGAPKDLTSMIFTDELGNITTYYYDKSGNKTREVDANQNTKTFTYTPSGKPLITYQDGVLEEYLYDQNGNVVQIKDANANISQYVYNAKNELISAADPLGNVTSFAYDLRGNKVQEIRPAESVESSENSGSAITRFEYDDANNLKTTIYPDGSRESQEFDALHRVISQTDKLGNVHNFERDNHGNIIRENSMKGEKTYEYDALSQLIKQVNERGNTVEYEYNTQGQVTLIKDTQQDAQQTTQYEYNPLGKVTKTTQCVDNVCTNTTNAYDLHGNLISQTDARGNVTTTEYDAVNRPTLQAQSGLVTISLEYDQHGNVAKRCKFDAQSPVQPSNPAQNCTTFDRDAKGNPVKQTDALGNATEYEYNASGLLSRVVNPQGDTKTFTYNAAGQLSAQTDELGNKTQYTHDEMNRPLSQIDALGNVTSVVYNQSGKIASRTDALGNVTEFEYNLTGDLARTLYPNGNIETYETSAWGQVLKQCTFDVNGEMSSTANPASTVNPAELTNCTSYEYDNLGRQISTTNALGQTQTNEYDAFNNVVKRINFDGSINIYVYDNFGQLVQESVLGFAPESVPENALENASELAPAPPSNSIVTTHEYDNFGREIRLTQTTPNSNTRTSFTEYDNFGQVISNTGFEGIKTTTTYDLLGRAVQNCQVGIDASALNLQVANEGARICTTTQYEQLGNTASTSDAQGGVTRYEYDPAGRRVKQIDPLGNITRMAYDELGRQIQQQNALGYVSTTDYDAFGKVTNMTDPLGATTSFEYDQSGNKVLEVDPLGNATNYTYSLTGQLLVEESPGGLQTFYHYDNLGRILEQSNSLGAHSSFEYNTSGDLTKTSQMLNDGTEAVTQNFYDASHNLVKTVNPLGGETHNEYDSFGQLIRTVSPSGKVQTSEYNNFGRLISHKSGSQLPVQYYYDTFGRQTATTQGEKTTLQEFDLLGNITKTTDARGNVHAYMYDVLGRNLSNCMSVIMPTSQSDSACTRSVYNALGQVTSQVDALGNAVTLDYDAAGNNTAIKAANGAMLQMNYDAAHQLSSTLDALGRGEIYQYDNMGNMISSTIGEVDAHALSVQNTRASAAPNTDLQNAAAQNVPAQNFTLQNTKTTHYQFDALGNQLSIITPERKVQGFQYDFNSKLISKRQQNGQLITYDYDKLGSLLRVQYDGQTAQNVYYKADSDGQRTQMLDASGQVVYTYNDAGQMASETHKDGKSIHYEYDGYGRLQILSTFQNDALKSKLSYEYDSLDRAISITDLQDRVTRFTYHGNNTSPESAQKADGTSTKYAYSLNGQVVKLTNYDAVGEVPSEFAYTYNSENQISQEIINLQRKNDGNNNTETITNNYKYDEVGQIILWSVQLSRFGENDDRNNAQEHSLSEEYAYDAFGNRIKLLRKYDEKVVANIAYTFSDDNQLITSYDAVNERKNEYQYDQNGNRITLQRKNSSGENIDTQSYEYDVENRLIAVRDLALGQNGAQLNAQLNGQSNGQNRLLMAATYDGDGNKVFEASRIREVFDAMQVYADNASFGPRDYILANGINTAVSNGESVTKYEFERKFDHSQNIFFTYGFTQHLLCGGTPIITPLAPICSMIFTREFNDKVLTNHELELGSADLQISTYKDLFKGGGSAVQNGLAEAQISHNNDADVNGFLNENVEITPNNTPDNLALPQDPPPGERDNYELTYYLNDANSVDNTRVLDTYNAQDQLRDSYTYLPSSATPLADFNSLNSDYSSYSFDGHGSVVTGADSMSHLLDGTPTAVQITTPSTALTTTSLGIHTYSPTGASLSNLLNQSIGRVGAPTQTPSRSPAQSLEQTPSPGFNAEVSNPLTGLQYLRARYLDAETGTFVTQDDQFGRVQSITSQNLYTYAENDGVNKVDPSGHSAQQYFDIMR
ncbi:MAG: DUF6531 domain-containing protein, partial [Candidatus Ancillula sp.]|nr:DUF6531 domain-containing protein [Candidatus Ancillula sp.]